MICFNCGKEGKKTGHDGCRNPTTPNEAGIKTKEAYRKKSLEKKKYKSSTRSNIDPDSSESDSDSDAESDMCMITSWETDDGTNTDEDDADPPPRLIPLTKILVPGNKKLAISKSKTSLSILFTSFSFEIQHIEFLVMDSSSMKADIILGIEFIEQYDIMSYLTNPECYNAVHAPLPADEESLDWETGIHANQQS